MGELKSIAINDLIVWTDNPRMANEQILSENDAIKILISEVGLNKMRALATDIFSNGLNPHRQPIVVQNDSGKYNIYDGNRRISVIKCVLSNDEQFNNIENAIGLTLESKILVYITDIQEAMRLIEIEHSGESEGRGQIQWEAFQRDYAFHQNNKVPIYPYAYNVSRVCKLSRKSHFTKIPYTDLDTIFSNEIIKKLFNVEKEWDFNDIDFIQNTYEKLLNAKNKIPYSRYLPRLKDENELNQFKQRLFPEIRKAEEESVDESFSESYNQPKDNSNNIETPTSSYDDAKNETATNSEQTKQSETSEYKKTTDTQKRKNNSYRTTPAILFQWQGQGINIDHAVFKRTLAFSIGLQINTDMELRRIAAYLYRVLLEIALRYWCNWYRSNEGLFNTGAINDYSNIQTCLLGTTSDEVSFVSENKIKNIICVLKNIKNNAKNQSIRDCFKGKSEQEYTNMIQEFNGVIHGSKEYIDKSTLEKYDEMVLNYLIALSTSLNE